MASILSWHRCVKGCVSLDPSKMSKSGWWGLQLDTWQLCNSLWYGLINSKLHINKKFFFISHNIRRCHTSNVFKVVQVLIHKKFQSLDDGVSSWIHDNCVIVCDMAWLIPNFISIKKIFFISHNIRRCHTSNVLNHPADLSVMDLTSDPSWFTHSPGKASTER